MVLTEPPAPTKPEQEHPEPFWERVAKTRWGSYITTIEERAILKACDGVGEPGLMLEVGCEAGRWPAMLVKRGWKIKCADVNGEMVALCQSRIPSAKCSVATTAC